MAEKKQVALAPVLLVLAGDEEKSSERKKTKSEGETVVVRLNCWFHERNKLGSHLATFGDVYQGLEPEIKFVINAKKVWLGLVSVCQHVYLAIELGAPGHPVARVFSRPGPLEGLSNVDE